MELESFEALADISLQEAHFYETGNNYNLSMSSAATIKSIKLDSFGKPKKRKCVTFPDRLPTYVQVTNFFLIFVLYLLYK